MTYESDLRYAWSLYEKGVDAEGNERQQYLRQAKNVLNNIPSGYDDRDELLSRIESMLY